MNPWNAVADDVRLGDNVRLSKFINLYGCEIGDETKIGAFVEIQKNASIGRRCKISSHSFICEGVLIEDNVFIGHGVMFINDTYPRATDGVGNLQTEADWKVERTVVGKGASIGSNATILCNVKIGENAIVGAGSVVTKDVPANWQWSREIPLGSCASSRNLWRSKCQTISHFSTWSRRTWNSSTNSVSAFRHGLRTLAAFVGGPVVENFEKDFAAFCDTSHAVAVSSGTDALRFAIMACGIEAGDVVLTVPNTFIATGEAISQARAIPEFVDIDEHTYNISVPLLERFLEKQCVRNNAGKLISLRSGRPVTAVVPVHLYGQMADMDARDP